MKERVMINQLIDQPHDENLNNDIGIQSINESVRKSTKRQNLNQDT